MARQLDIFGQESTIKPKVKSASVVFHDYESYIKKFTKKNNELTTDDTYTPQDVYEAVVAYVDSIYPLKDKQILRPFFPGGDYEHADYPDDGVVIDNPPFSIFTEICRWYSRRKIPFFLFGPGMTIFSVLKYCSVVVGNNRITFSNGAKVRINFATNLLGDTLVTTAVSLNKTIRDCPSQNKKADLPKYRYRYPDELLSVSDFQSIACGDVDFSVGRQEAVVVNNLDLHPKKSLFGDHLLVSKDFAAKAAAAKVAAKRMALDDKIVVELSERERKIVDELGLTQS